MKRLLVEPLKYGANEPGQYSDHTHPRYIRITDISEDGRLRDDSFRSLPKEIAEPYLLTGGDILFARSGATVGKTFQYRPNWGKAAHAGYLIRARFNKTAIEPDFIEYYTQSQIYRDWILGISIQATIQNVSAERYGGLRIPLPPLSEQRAIVRYLDYADRRIRRYIDVKQKLIDLLEEEKQAIINQAVTRGLDPNVHLKPSGVEWLGDVPEHWELIQLGRIGRFSKGGGGTKEDEVDAGLPCIRYGDIYMNHKYHIEHSRSYITPERCSDYTSMRYGDILFAGSGETIEEIGKSAVNLLDEEAYCGGDVILFRPGIDMNARFMGYAADCFQGAYQKSCMGRGITIMHIYSSQLKYMCLVLPPLSEQTAIVEHLDKATADIDTAITRARRQIELLEEYRTRLIADVVTGKLDVREAAAQLPYEDDDGHDPMIEESDLSPGVMSADPQDPAARSFVEA